MSNSAYKNESLNCKGEVEKSYFVVSVGDARTEAQVFLDGEEDLIYTKRNEHSFRIAIPMNTTQTDKRDAIIRATVKLISEYGFHGAPMAMVAKEACVGAGTIYRYFKDKDHLVAEIFLGLDSELKKTLLVEYDMTLSIRDRFLHLCLGVFRYGVTNPSEFKFIEQFYHSPYGTSLYREKLYCCACKTDDDPLGQVFLAGQEQRVIKDLPVAVLLALAIGPIVFLIKDHINGLVQLGEGTITDTIAACWDAVKR